MALLGTLSTSVSALDAFTTGLDTVGNNIANVDTTAFKGSNVTFADTYDNMGTQVESNDQSFAQGALATTGNPTDLAISGNGYFVVATPGTGNFASQYATRDGEFSFNSTGYLVNAQGQELVGYTGGTATSVPPGTIGAIQISQTSASGSQLQSVSIGNDGTVTETYADGTTAANNQVLLLSVTNPQLLVSQGNNLYTDPSVSGTLSSQLGASSTPNSSGLGTLQSGALEQSNVDLTQQFSDMITLQRAFEANARMITISDTILDDVVNMKSH